MINKTFSPINLKLDGFSYIPTADYYISALVISKEKMAADPKTQEWWDLVKPFQKPLNTRKEGEWWADMEEVYHLD